MPSLPEFPNEILYNIIDQIHPDDIINFSLSHEHFRGLSEDVVSVHLQRKKMYENISLHGCHRHHPNGHPLCLIRDIFTDWKIGEYPKVLTFECCARSPYDSLDLDDDEAEEEMYNVVKEEDDLLVSTILQGFQDYIEERLVDLGVPETRDLKRGELRCDVGLDLTRFNVEASCRELTEGDRGARVAMLAILLLFVPNIKTICFKKCTWGIDDLGYAIHWISKQILQRDSNARKPLMDLSQVRFLGNHELWRGECFETFMPFATLPSMRTIFGDYVEGRDEGEAEWVFPPHTSNVTEIVLQHSAIKALHLSHLLVGIKALKRFTYHRQENHDPGYENFDNCPIETHQIIGALLEHAKHSLEFLSLTGRCHRRRGEFDLHPCKGSLRGFQVLKETVLNSDIYVEHVPYSGPELDANEISYVEKGGHISRHLVDLLPSSIETMLLVGDEVADHAPGLLDEFCERKQTRLPKLSKLLIGKGRYHPGEDWVTTLWKKCRKVGVELKIETAYGYREEDGSYRIN